jgi:hypothetical protein
MDKTMEEVLRASFGNKAHVDISRVYENGLAGHYPDSIQRTNIYKAMKEYARLACRAQREICAREASLKHYIADSPDIDEDSILNAPEPELK